MSGTDTLRTYVLTVEKHYNYKMFWLAIQYQYIYFYI